MATPPAMRGAVLEGWPEGSDGARQLGGVYRAAGAHAGLPRFEGAEPGASARHMYRYKKGGADMWFVNCQFAPEETMCVAYVAPLPGGAVPEHRRAPRWHAASNRLGLPRRDGKHYLVPDAPLVLTALVRAPRRAPAAPRTL